MGMAASQARLLSITASLHDVEFKAQSIMNAKIELATQSDQVYKNYLKALEDTTLTIKDFQGTTVQANFNNIRGLKAVDTGKKYALKASNGLLIVSQEEKNAYDKFQKFSNKNAQKFALMMVIGDYDNSIDDETLKTIEDDIYDKHKDGESEADQSLKSYKEKLDNLIKGKNIESLSKEDRDKYNELNNAYKTLLYNNYGKEIYRSYTADGNADQNYNQEDFNYYVNLYNQIELAGGCISISDYDGPNGDASNNSEWLENMIKCGKITMYLVEDDKKGKVKFNATAPSSDTNIDYTTTTNIDKTALAKAEAIYEHQTKDINQKEKKFDIDLEKLNTKRTALNKEYETMKKVIDNNIEKTYSIFNS